MTVNEEEASGGSSTTIVKNEKDIIYVRPSTSWVLLWTLGSIIFILLFMGDINFYYIHFYFYISGVCYLLYSYSKYATIDASGLRYYYGLIGFRKEIKLPWKEIIDIRLHYYTKRS